MARLTRDEKHAMLVAENRTRKVTEFKRKIETERARRTFDKRNAFDDRDPVAQRSAQVLYQMVDDCESAAKRTRQLYERFISQATDGLRRLDRNDTPSSYSTVFGDMPADIEQAAAKYEALRGSVSQLAWATGWYVPQVASLRERDARELLVSLDVVFDGNVFVVRSTDAAGVMSWLTLSHDPNKPLMAWTSNMHEAQEYATEEDAWVVAMGITGERL